MKWIIRFLIFIVAAFFFLSFTGMVFLFEAPLLLFFGWIGFIKNIILYARPEPAVIAEGIAAILLLCTGLHLFLSKICTGAGTSENKSITPEKSQWKLRWTLSGLAVFILMFVTSIALTGIIHQTGWLFRGPLAQSRYQDSAKERHTRIIMGEIIKALEHCHAENEYYPVTNGTIDIQYAGISSEYIKNIPLDAWQTPFQYSSDGQTYTIRSYGANRILGGGKGKFDDIVYADGMFLTSED